MIAFTVTESLPYAFCQAQTFSFTFFALPHNFTGLAGSTTIHTQFRWGIPIFYGHSASNAEDVLY